MTDYQTTYQLNENLVEQLVQLYQNEWWTRDRTLQQTREILKNSDLVIGITDSHQLIAFARVLTDKTIKAIIFDLIVHPEYRDKGIGCQMMKTILDHPDLGNVRDFELYCLEELETFYSRHGFKSINGQQIYMRRSKQY